ncbi:MAG: hypothetical protein RL641_567 [Candidatus Parcubacteria bacterium]
MDIDNTQNNVTEEVCKCGCKEGTCVCENCTNKECDCGICKTKIEAPAETPAV